MDDERILERERYQIERIRQLESEELQVEEVEESSDDDDVQTNSGGVPTSVEFTYDTSLAALHSYLGEVEDTHNRLSFLDGGAVLTLPLLYIEGKLLDERVLEKTASRFAANADKRGISSSRNILNDSFSLC